MKRKIRYIVFILIIFITTAFLLSSSLFFISNINVTGNINVSTDEAIRLSMIRPGQNIFRINTKKSMKYIFQNPFVKTIKIKRKLPNTIIIDIVEREAIALVPYVGSFLNIDEDGMIIKISTLEDKPDLPVINGLNFDTFKIGELLSIDNEKQFDLTVKIIKEIKAVNLIGKIQEVDISDIYSIKLNTNTDIKVNMGDDRRLSYKMAFAKSIIEDVEEDDLTGTIEMSHEGNPIFRPE